MALVVYTGINNYPNITKSTGGSKVSYDDAPSSYVGLSNQGGHCPPTMILTVACFEAQLLIHPINHLHPTCALILTLLHLQAPLVISTVLYKPCSWHLTSDELCSNGNTIRWRMAKSVSAFHYSCSAFLDICSWANRRLSTQSIWQGVCGRSSFSPPRLINAVYNSFCLILLAYTDSNQYAILF